MPKQVVDGTNNINNIAYKSMNNNDSKAIVLGSVLGVAVMFFVVVAAIHVWERFHHYL